MTPSAQPETQISPTISVRIDKWLWAVRVFKTRSLAAQACQHGHVTFAGQPVKPARQLRVNDIVIVKKDQMTRTFKVRQLIERRVGAAAAREFVEDLTPASEFERAREARLPIFVRPKGAGRPTKKERRQIDAMAADGPEE